ncbi:MAG TPA: LacI family DNA-binding transcriptional regulator [Holophaga sp.]|mgnify:CR=1 FL=1|jgi:DNA-binding LacI/PurR family transcriptional regulator|nr:LacI family DNA-binding transcriptional regulator [Holophaga sp.]
MPTIADVAVAAGVSKSTVSRVLSGHFSHIKPATREKVMATVESMNFRPSRVARSLSVRKTYTIGVLVSDIGNPFYADVIHGIEDAGLSKGYSFFLGNTGFDPRRGMDLVNSLIDRRVDGVISLFSRASEDWMSLLSQQGIPASVVNWDFSLTPGLVSISVDFEPGIKAAVEHLVGLGHKHFAHISGPVDLFTSRQRQAVFLDALAACGIPASNVAIIEGDFSVEGGRRAAGELLKRRDRPTAVFAANDQMAIGVMAEARSLGLELPEDLSVVGLDDIWPAAQMEPPLSTVAMPRYEIGFQAMERLMELFQREDPVSGEPLEAQVTTRFIQRASTAGPSHRGTATKR